MQDNTIQGLDNDLLEETLELLSSDNKSFIIPQSYAIFSNYLENIINVDSHVQQIKLIYIDSKIVEKIIEWMQYHKNHPPKNIPRPLSSNNLKSIVGYWDAEFIDCDLDTIYQLLLAANFLGMISLLELCCAKIASLVLGKTAKKIKETFKLPEIFTDEEEAKLQKEFAIYFK